MPAYKFPNVSFDWLGELPELAEESRLRGARKEALADLDSSDPKSLRAAANRLMATGGLKEMEMGMRLHATAQAREALSQRGREADMYSQGIPGLSEVLSGGGGGGPAAVEAPPPAPAPAPAPQYNWPAPGAPGGGTIPGIGPGAMAPPPEPSPSEALLAAAESPAQPVAPGPMLAQAGPRPELLPPAPPPPQPPWLQGAQMPAVPAPPPAAAAQPPAARVISPQREAEQEAARIQSVLFSMRGTKAPPAVLQGLMVRYRNALERTQLTPDQKNYEYEQAQRAAMGEPRITMEAWEARRKTGPKTFDEVVDLHKEYRKAGSSAREMTNILDRMDTIIKSPDFKSGLGAVSYTQAVSGLNTLAQIAKGHGIELPPDWFPGLQARLREIADPALRSTALMQEYTALSNRLIKESLGTLGNQISNADREFIERSYPNLTLTPEGNMALHRFLRTAMQRSISAEQAAREYRQKAGERANAPDMEEYIARKREATNIFIDKEGKPTQLGRELEAETRKHAPTAAPAAAPPPMLPPAMRRPEARDVEGPGGTKWRLGPDGILRQVQ